MCITQFIFKSNQQKCILHSGDTLHFETLTRSKKVSLESL